MLAERLLQVGDSHGRGFVGRIDGVGLAILAECAGEVAERFQLRREVGVVARGVEHRPLEHDAAVDRAGSSCSAR